MDDMPRIEPRCARMHLSSGSNRVAEIELGGVPRGAVIVVSEAGRLELEAFDAMNTFAAHGYVSVAADLAVPAKGTRPADRDLLCDVGALLERLAGRGWASEQVGIVGSGLGGRVALLAAAEFPLGGAVSFSPEGVTAEGLRDPAPVRTPWLGLFGGRDRGTPLEAIVRLRDRLETRSPAHVEIVSYPLADGHFHRGGAATSVHTAYFDGWQRAVEWLNLRVVPRPTPLAQRWAQRVAARMGDRGLPVLQHTTSEG
jgi:carboxymethylenebutenolidase